MHSAEPENGMELAVQRALTDPGWFCSDILRSPNHPWQTELMDAVADLDRSRMGLPTLANHALKRRFTVRAGHGKGKTHYLAKLAFWWNFTRRGRNPCTAPKEQQLKTRLWPEMRKLYASAIPEFQKLLTVQSTAVQWCGDPDWCSIAETASEPENLAGYHDTWLLVIADEASGISDKFIPTIEGALTNPGNVLILSGNTTRTEGEFFRSHMKSPTRDLYYQRHVKWEETPTDMAAFGRDMIHKYGSASPVVRVRLYGEFVDMAEGQLIALEWIEAARLREIGGDGSLPQLRIAVDVADGGEDETVVTAAWIYATRVDLVTAQRFSFEQSKSPIEAAKAAMRIAESLSFRHDRDVFVVDGMGVGAGTAGYLMEAKQPVIVHRGGESSDDPVQWRNRRVQSYIVMRNAFRDGTIAVADDFVTDLPRDWDDFVGQLTSIVSKPGTERVEDLETKMEMKRRGIKSPDMADSCAMLFTGQRASFETQRFQSNAEIQLIGGLGSVIDAEVM